MIEMLTYPFMQKAFLTGILVAIACAALGTYLILKKFSLIGDGLAHIAFGGIATGLLFGITPFISSLIFALIGSISILKLKEKTAIHADTAIGIISHASLGLGIFIASIARGFNTDILSYLFGSILAIKDSDLILSTILALSVIAFILLYNKDLFYVTFDEESAKVSGINTNFLNSMLIILTAITIVSSMNVVGLLLASALIIIPPSSALQLKTSFKKTILWAITFAILSIIIGLVTAYYLDYAVSGTIVLINTLIFLIIMTYKKFENYFNSKKINYSNS
ncbi:MAG: metal ABC transporter permease [Candidatus ainarchaeum sp.]|mgnify:CR=1 FL=1|jgi:zinc transport system permease protein|nr:metal ABC transporter permease [Candidatus ainarchaeum sp.]MDD3085869.1 metal ABC transporter permease [Candidatus ainarchaeum sp.]MDD4128611.1 metal ABC transporter permease [Candidatus ainarchaeum sp.]MDD4468041.1 metal ABC transporter permease [Candidatus ainarchaeum sp.]HPM85821.1 metal ABC transporter permease [archaeon]